MLEGKSPIEWLYAWSLFWLNRSQQDSSTIDTLLEKGDCQVEELLDDDKLLEVIKFSSDKVIK